MVARVDCDKDEGARVSGRIAKLTLDDAATVRRTPEAEREQVTAIDDLLRENSFVPKGLVGVGPFHVSVGLEDQRLTLGVSDTLGQKLCGISVPLRPFRGLVRDYFLMCESYYNAVSRLPPDKIEAIDQGRRSLHDEGAILLRSALADRVTLDINTARRLFTLICVLQMRL